MANYVSYIKRTWNVSVGTIFKDTFSKKDPNEFRPNGSQIYYGYQGEGKTLSMYHHFTKLKRRYPKAVVISNLRLKYLNAKQPRNIDELQEVMNDFNTQTDYILFESYDELVLHLRNTRNGQYGVIFLIDEIHNYFHSHDSKSMPMWIVQVFSQQRKQRLVILGTVQDWPDVIKVIRRQVDNLIECRRVGYIIRNTAIDPRTMESQYGETTFQIRKRGFFFITERLRSGFDTFQVINSGREVFGGSDGPTIVLRDKDTKSRGVFKRKKR